MSKIRKDRVAIVLTLASLISYGAKNAYDSSRKPVTSNKLEEMMENKNPEELLNEGAELIEKLQVKPEEPIDMKEVYRNNVDKLWKKLSSNEDFLTLCRLFDCPSSEAYQMIYDNYNFIDLNHVTDSLTRMFLERSGLKDRAGTEVYDYLLNDSIGQSILKNSITYGVDPLLMYSLCKQESNLDHYNHIVGEGDYRGTAYGVTQQEKTTIGGTYKGTNQITGEVDQVKSTKDSLKDLDTNVQLATMKIQSYLKKYNGNIPLALISYNYGGARGEDVAQAAARDYGVSVDELSKTPNALSLILKHAKNLHNHPGDYFKTTRESDYGDGEYVLNICRKAPTKYLYGLKDSSTDQITVLDTSNSDQPKYIITSIEDYEQSFVQSTDKTYVKE